MNETIPRRIQRCSTCINPTLHSAHSPPSAATAATAATAARAQLAQLPAPPAPTVWTPGYMSANRGIYFFFPAVFFFRAFGFKMELVPPCTQGSSGPGQLPPRTFLSASSMKASCASWRSPFCYALRFSSSSLLLFAEGRLSCLEGPPRKAPQRRWPRRQSG